MQITDVRLRKVNVNSENRMKAVASVTFDNEFVIHDIKVIESQNGLFIACNCSSVHLTLDIFYIFSSIFIICFIIYHKLYILSIYA